MKLKLYVSMVPRLALALVVGSSDFNFPTFHLLTNLYLHGKTPLASKI
jgi:hypothetical protein